MLQSILIGLDGSPDSLQALELGIQWASKLELRLVGLAIVDEPAIQHPEPLPIGAGAYRAQAVEGLLEEAHRKVQQALDHFNARCTEAEVDYLSQIDTGTPSEEILRESQRCDLVLLGHETHFSFRTENRADATQWNVLKHTPRPVVVVPPTLKPGSSVVVAYDGSPSADRALQAFQASGLEFEEQVYVVSVDPDLTEANCCAERAVEFLRSHNIAATAIPHGAASAVAEAILEQVRSRNARLLVMGAYGHSTMREFLLGSVTNVVLRKSPVPVFLCH